MDKSRNNGGGLVYVRKDIPNKELKMCKMPNDTEGVFIELNLIKTKWLFCGFNDPPS